MFQLFQKNSNPKQLNLKEIWRVYRIYSSVSSDAASISFSRLTPYHIREILHTFYSSSPAKDELQVIQSFTRAFEENHFPEFYKFISGVGHVKS
jgi:hypothetical protein